MTSNGIIINEEMADYFAHHKIKVLLSIDGLEDSHNRFRVDKNGNSTFRKAMETVEILKKTQGWVGIKMTVMQENLTSLFEDVKGLYQMGINQFLITPASGRTWSLEDMKSFGKQWDKLYHWYKKKPRKDLRISEFDKNDENSSYFGCQAGRNSIALSVNGEISSCSKLLAKNNKQLISKLGDVNYGLTHIKNRLELVNCSRLKHACENKNISKDFQEGCFAANYEENNNIFQPSMQEYVFNKIIKSTLLNY